MDYSPAAVINNMYDVLATHSEFMDMSDHDCIIKIGKIVDGYRNQPIEIVHSMRGVFETATRTGSLRYGKPLPYNQETVRNFQLTKTVEAMARDILAIVSKPEPVKPFRFEEYGA